MDAILIPLKPSGRAKHRLATLSTEQKSALQLAMVRDVLTAIPPDLPIYLVTGGISVEGLGRSAIEMKIVDDPGEGLNAAITKGWSAMARDGVSRAVVVQGDIPLLRSQEVRSVLDRKEPVVVAPSADGGTSILATSPPGVIAPRFGPSSGDLHVTAAREAGLDVALVKLDGGSLDIDDEHGLRMLAGMSGPFGQHSRALAAAILEISSAGEAQAPALS